MKNVIIEKHSITDDFEMLFQNLPDLYLLLSEDLTIAAINDAYVRTMEIDPNKIIGKSILTIFPGNTNKSISPPEADKLNKSLSKVLQNKIADSLLIQDSKDRYWNCLSSPVIDTNKKVEYIIVRIEDVTNIVHLKHKNEEQHIFINELKESFNQLQAKFLSTEQQIEEANKKHELSTTELNQFAYLASHDLQEPLRTVTSYVQLIKNNYTDKLDKDADDFISFAIDGCNRMRALINSLLQYSRINRTRSFELINCNELIEDVLQNINTNIKENNTTIITDELPVVMGDPALLSELFQQLITNAIKFRSDKNPEIKISTNKTGDHYLFSIEDNGIGFEQKHSDKIFEIFQRLNAKEKYQGTGMGLAICKKIIERHSGRIWAESEIEKGSVFHFTIPQ
jgi:signal transduction histidine kinase